MIYTKETAKLCPKYKDSSWEGCMFSPAMDEAVKNCYTVCVCSKCLTIQCGKCGKEHPIGIKCEGGE
jgi:hypothetical protein